MSRKLRASISIPLLCVALLITSCTLDQGFLSLIAHASDQDVIIVQATPTSIPQAQIGGITQRIRFAAGATSAQVSRQIDGNSIDTYLLEARAGQQMQALVSSPYGNVYLTVVSPSGSPLARAQAGAQSFSGTLPEIGRLYPANQRAGGYGGDDLHLQRLGDGRRSAPTTQPGQPSNQRIRFASGATSASVNGEVDGTYLSRLPARSAIRAAHAGQHHLVGQSALPDGRHAGRLALSAGAGGRAEFRRHTAGERRLYATGLRPRRYADDLLYAGGRGDQRRAERHHAADSLRGGRDLGECERTGRRVERRYLSAQRLHRSDDAGDAQLAVGDSLPQRDRAGRIAAGAGAGGRAELQR